MLPNGEEQTFAVDDPITWADIANFAARTGDVTTEPAHVILVGAETNFISTARQHTVPGELRDQRAVVRFTPVAWTWDYGDGTTKTTSTPGATWEQLHLEEFSRTATSHAYTENGDYTIRAAVTLRAEYSIPGGGWTPIAGTLTLPSDTIDMTAFTATTVLVAQDCDANPTGPGCD